MLLFIMSHCKLQLLMSYKENTKLQPAGNYLLVGDKI